MEQRPHRVWGGPEQSVGWVLLTVTWLSSAWQTVRCLVGTQAGHFSSMASLCRQPASSNGNASFAVDYHHCRLEGMQQHCPGAPGKCTLTCCSSTVLSPSKVWKMSWSLRHAPNLFTAAYP